MPPLVGTLRALTKTGGSRMDFLQHLPPGTIIMLGALLIPFLPRKLQGWGAVVLPLLSAGHLLGYFSDGFTWTIDVMGNELMPIRVDKLSLLFGYIFHIAGFLSALYALKADDTIQHLSGMVYVGSAIGAVFCGDLISLFMYWELTAISSVFLIWASRDESSLRCGVRYLVIQVASGVILLAGALIHFHQTGSLAFVNFADAGLTNGTTLILWSFGIKAAFPFLHNWLQDAYPKATYSGTVFLSAFTTKLAIYALARGFAGTGFLIPIGCLMTVFPIFFAVIENDLRKVLAYSLNNQLGFMVVGIGIGTELAINGACAHAFAHIIYKGLLFMSMGAVLFRVGTTKASELGGLHRTMPWTTTFCIIGAMSISAFPLLSGFAAKSLIASAAGGAGLAAATFVLYFASAGVMEHSGIKIPFFAFFAHDSGKRPKEAPWHMLLAMGIAAAMCIGIGVYPQGLYSLLPYQTDYYPYDVTHVITQLELLLFAALAFGVLMRLGIYPAEKRSVNLDFDWVYRKLIPSMLSGAVRLVREVGQVASVPILRRVSLVQTRAASLLQDRPQLGSTENSGFGALWAALLLGVYLILYYV
jgi:multicomponent Na+:H+ antiporter subunit D